MDSKNKMYICTADCTDFGGAFYFKGQTVELDPSVEHSIFLAPVEAQTTLFRDVKAKTKAPKKKTAKAE